MKIKFNNDVNNIIDANFETLGTNTIMGYLSMFRMSNINSPVYKVTLIFPQSSSKWKIKNNGPKCEIIYEHTLPSILNDILMIASKGIEIVIETPEE